jgi:selenocysteine-specific elongation factor
VDHGKSTLVKALTGMDPDRLKEEKERQMTIDLGFAWLTLPNGQSVSIVDVPGHEAFIKNMLAGVGGIDAAMLVIAADEGVMPQTREHLAILDLLHIKGGLVALTKKDLVDAEWLDLVTADIRQILADTVLARAPIIPVSAKTREGLPELLDALERVLQTVPPKNDVGKPRLPIDRVFSMPGFGTVVTGTLIDGALAVGDEVEIVPGAKRGRIRGVQSHKEKLERALPGRRVALNLASLSVEDLQRGQVVTLPGLYRATTLLDARVQYLPDAPKPLPHNAQVDFFTGAVQVVARVRLLEHEELKPGESGWVQFHLAAPIAVAKNDRFIFRSPSPSVTLGGGIVVDPHPAARHRRFKPEVLARLETLARGTPEEIVWQFLTARGSTPAEIKDIVSGTGLSEASVAQALSAQAANLIVLGTLYLTTPHWRTLAEKIRTLLSEYHRQYPLRAGLPREELKSRLGLAPRVFERVLERAALENILVANEDVVRQPDFVVTFTPELQKKIDALLAQFHRAPYTPPSAQDAEAAIGIEAVNALVAQGTLVRLNDQVLLTPQALQTMHAWVVATIQTHGEVTVAQVRDHFNTSRKYAVALLEYFDEKRVTKRVGDARVLR